MSTFCGGALNVNVAEFVFIEETATFVGAAGGAGNVFIEVYPEYEDLRFNSFDANT